MGMGRALRTAALVALANGCAVGAAGAPSGGGEGGVDATASPPSGKADAREVTSIFGDAGAPPSPGSGDGALDAGGDGGRSSDAAGGDAPLASGSGAGDGGALHDAGHDASVTCPEGMAGPGCAECASGYHLCGATCTINGANVPSTGCASACGTGACVASGSQAAYCTDAGACALEAPACPSGEVMCSTGCAQCCTSSDCAAGETCTSGTCGPSSPSCPPNYGTCVTPCDTDFSQPENCGGCGNNCNDCSVCDDNFPFCSFVGTGCECDGDGTDADSYSCF